MARAPPTKKIVSLNEERVGDHGTEQTLEPTKITCVDILSHRRLPVAEAVHVVERVTSNHGDEGEHHQANSQNDFTEREPELRLSIIFDSTHVDEEIKCQFHGNRDGRRIVVSPVVDQGVEQGKLERDQGALQHPKVPTSHETERLVNTSLG
ncbi:hypothetical protein OGAPHI_005926 [Ogataea philodendri]|uniref:Uncharacterized protein n=1 Tax=Ogataea philodendri TaxID=1378263 RepID=A0A9P8NWV0_9ASCO|nr:uncharacterized protein OGAPHI_005926 [Ogataea philodendri]KAH3661748.1 hypothetical protein OGAPHI_005926 [Ogataea philodendri]